jgi:cytochrome c oxidase assembly protein subunit 11
VFLARNPLPGGMVAQAIPSVSPSRAAEYFHKTECFCFNQQPLDGRAVGGDAAAVHRRSRSAAGHLTITLSYTLFDVTDMASGAVASR